MSDDTCTRLLELLARWQAFSELQQRAFEFLATEAMTTGQEFERSTDGATGVLTRIGQTSSGSAADLQSETFQVVQKLQAADRSRQGLEQVASVLTTLRQQHAELLSATRATAHVPETEAMLAGWIEAMSANVTLADWRRRLVDALNGRESAPAAPCEDEDVLF
ncbi:MAG: hypothetical protein ACM31D_10090 [Bacteroidota bacterium]